MKALATLLLAMLLMGCNQTPCESNLDCLIQCQCPGTTQTLIVGPYECRASYCGERHRRDLTCEDPCDRNFTPPVDTQDPFPEPDDDDSASADDDDSAPADDDDSGR